MKEADLFRAHGLDADGDDTPDEALDDERTRPTVTDGYVFFWEHVRKLPGSGCWLWTGPTTQNGYGRLTLPNGSVVPAHIYAYTTEVGPVPDGQMLRHRGPRRRCVRPDHWFPLTRAENMGMQRTSPKRDETDREREFRDRRRAAIASSIPHVVNDISTSYPHTQERDRVLVSTIRRLHGDD